MQFAGKMLATGVIAMSLMIGNGIGGTSQAALAQATVSDVQQDQVMITKSHPSEKQHSHKKKHGWKYAERLAKVLGITKEELMLELKNGKSIAEIAKGKGISEDQLIEKLKESMIEDLREMIHKKRTTTPSHAPENTDE